MDGHRVDLIATWRQAEREASPEDADRLFATLARDWARAPVPAGLASRVVRRVVRDRVQPSPWDLWWVRLAVAVPVLAAGVVLSWHSSDTLIAMALAVFGNVAAGVESALWAAAAWGETVVAVGRPLARVAAVVGKVMTAPVPALFCVLNVLLSAGAVVVLRRVLAVREV